MPPGERVRRERLDRLLVLRGLAPTRVKAQALILAGQVLSGSLRLDKPGTRVPVDAPLEVLPGRRWVGRGARKLCGALDAFAIDPQGCDAIDVGSSTGGFTQVLLERGARRVIALDVGRGQLDWTLRNDDRVHLLEGVNARHLEPGQLPFPPVIAVVDVSFISLRLVLPAVIPCLQQSGDVVALVKPQFEAGREAVGRGGIVRDPLQHRAVLERIAGFIGERGWSLCALAGSPIRGAEGNREFFVHLRPAGPSLAIAEIPARIAAAVEDGA